MFKILIDGFLEKFEFKTNFSPALTGTQTNFGNKIFGEKEKKQLVSELF